MNNSTKYYISKITKPRKSVLINGSLSKNRNWIQIRGVPVKVIEETTEYILLNSLTSGKNKNFKITRKELEEEFKKAKIEKNYIINCNIYKRKININEFKKRDQFSKFQSKINKIIKKIDNSNIIKNIIIDKFWQTTQTQGCPKTANLSQYDSYKRNENTNKNKHTRIGDPIFNRNVRWCPPVDITYEEFQKSKSFPAPIGIRPKDFALPSEVFDTVIELVRQILCFKGVELSNDIKKEFSNLFSEVGYKNILENCKIHKCKYCSKEVNCKEYNSGYKSANNFIEICHRDPNNRFIKENLYWGHGECNRRQGGYTEKERIEDIFGLLENENYSKEYIDKLIKKLKKLKKNK